MQLDTDDTSVIISNVFRLFFGFLSTYHFKLIKMNSMETDETNKIEYDEATIDNDDDLEMSFPTNAKKE